MSIRVIKYLAIILLLLTSLSFGACSNSDDTSQPPRRVAREVGTLFDDLARLEFAFSPEAASQIGLDEEIVGYAFHGQLDDRSQAGWESRRLQRLQALERLEHAPLPPLGSRLRADMDTVLNAYRSTTAMAAFGHGKSSLGFAAPYAFDQLTGAYIDVPDLLISRQPIHDRDDAAAYISRLSQLGDAINDDRRRLLSDARAGVAPPDFILARMRMQALGMTAEPAETHILVTTIENLMAGGDELDMGTRNRIVAAARRITQAEILPAYQALAATLTELEREATSEPGIWVLPDGQDYYDAALAFYTGETTPAEELHARGLALVKDLSLQLDVALVAAGYVEGSVGERLAQLTASPDQLFENSEAGRAELIASLNERMNALQARLDEILARPPRTPVTIARVPGFMQDSAPGGYYQNASADGSSPGIFYINLRDTSEWPAYSLPTLVFHEAAPGHHVESAVSQEAGELPLIRQLIWQSSYGEGWALYAEDLADEMGFYDEDPLGRIGYLQSLLFRAARMVTDTGLHRMRWGREEAIDYLVDITGQPRSAMATEVDRYAVWPGQAVSYMAGRERIRALRERARGVLGAEFDLAAFNYAILVDGPRPLDILERDMDAWVEAQLPQSR